MSTIDRTLAICDLLLGAAHADDNFHDRERETVRELLVDLHGSAELPSEVEARMDLFNPATFDVDKTAAQFKGDSEDDRRKLLYLVAAVHEADEELDFAEDDYIRALAEALDLPENTLTGVAIDFEVEELKETFDKVRKGPPPVPGAQPAAKLGEGSVDVDIDE